MWLLVVDTLREQQHDQQRTTKHARRKQETSLTKEMRHAITLTAWEQVR